MSGRLRLSVRARAALKRAALDTAEQRRDQGDPAFSARDFLAVLLDRVLGPRDCSIIMARLQPVGLMNRVQCRCQFERCENLSQLGMVFCTAHLHEAAVIDTQTAKTEGEIRRCNFIGVNPDWSRGCSLYFRSLHSDLCAFHRKQGEPPKPPPPGGGATIYTLPPSTAPKRRAKKKKGPTP